MKLDNKAKILVVFFVALLVFSALTLFYWDFVRGTIIIPIYYFIWVSNLTLKSIPQQAFLALLMVIGFLVGLNTLISVGAKSSTKDFADAMSPINSRYTYWKKLCSNLHSSSFARDSFASEARKLIIATLMAQNGIDSIEVEASVRNGTLIVPPSIKDLIQYRKIKDPSTLPEKSENIIERMRRLLLKEDPHNNPPIDGPITEIVAFIEHQLEINHVTNQPES